MNSAEASRRLRAMHDPEEQSILPHLFGIRYAADLAVYSVAELSQIAEGAGLPGSYGGEIRRGVRIARYVEWRGAGHSGL